MNNTHAIILIAIMTAVTLLLRILPFFIFGERKTPPYISFLGNRKQEKMEELQRVKGFIRTELSKKLKLYKTPDLVFILDDSYDRGQRIEDLIKEIHRKDQERENNTEEE